MQRGELRDKMNVTDRTYVGTTFLVHFRSRAKAKLRERQFDREWARKTLHKHRSDNARMPSGMRSFGRRRFRSNYLLREEIRRP